MPFVLRLRPTLWRTCRVLANRTRLRILTLLLRNPDQPVSAVADQLQLPLPIASVYLRAMESRGLLVARRAGRRVRYSPASNKSETPLCALLTALRMLVRTQPGAAEIIFRAATAFTHPRRIEIYRALENGSQRFEQLRRTTQIPAPSLRRHLGKLRARGFVTSQAGCFITGQRSDALGRELARLAAS